MIEDNLTAVCFQSAACSFLIKVFFIVCCNFLYCLILMLFVSLYAAVLLGRREPNETFLVT